MNHGIKHPHSKVIVDNVQIDNPDIWGIESMPDTTSFKGVKWVAHASVNGRDYTQLDITERVAWLIIKLRRFTNGEDGSYTYALWTDRG